MRCDDLIRELASPTGTLPPAAMAGHLASCPACAEWSSRAARLDRIWEATRPPEPSIQDSTPSGRAASAALDAPSVGRDPVLQGPGRRRGRWAMVAFFGGPGGGRPGRGRRSCPREVRPASRWRSPGRRRTRVIANVDQTVIVRIDDDGHRVEILDELRPVRLAHRWPTPRPTTSSTPWKAWPPNEIEPAPAPTPNPAG